MLLLSRLVLLLSSSSSVIRRCSALVNNNVRLNTNVVRRATRERVCMLRDKYDLVVIGGGPVGISACLRASSKGRNAILIDATPARQFQFTGPTGLFSKAIRDAALKLDVRVLRSMGIGDAAIWAQVTELVDSIVRKCGDDNAQALSLARVPHLRGRGTISKVDGGLEVEVAYDRGDVATLKCGHALIATGSRAVRLPCVAEFYEEDATCAEGHRHFFDSDSIKQLSFLPRKVIVVGGGIIAVEYARIFAELDAEVTLIVRAEDLATSLRRVGIDKGMAGALQEELVRAGVKLCFQTEIASADFTKKAPSTSKRFLGSEEGALARRFKVRLKKSESQQLLGTLDSDLVLTATGRSAVTQNMGLPKEALAKNGDILVKGDLRLQWAPETISAAGDVVGSPQLASTGVAQAEAAVDAIFNENPCSEVDFSPAALTSNAARYPIGIWTVPEVAFVGLTDEAAAEAGFDVVVGEALYADTIRGHIASTNLGPSLKLVVERSKPHRVLGVHIFGQDAAELIHFGTTLVQDQKGIEDVLALCYAAVTYHELYKNAGRKALEIVHLDEWRAFFHASSGKQDLLRREDLKQRLLSAASESCEEDTTDEILRLLFAKDKDTLDLDLFLKRVLRLESSLQRTLQEAEKALPA